MRLWLLGISVAALAACSDSSTPTATKNATPKIGATGFPEGFTPDSSYSAVLDPRPVPERLEEMVSRNFGKVRLPADSYSHSADAVHPDIVCPGDSWNAVSCWLLYTPYKGGDNTYENPSFLYVADDTSWGTPVSLTNPIIPYPGSGKYNSDPDHAYDPGAHRLVQIYRVVGDGFNNIMVMSTANARQWTTPRLAFREANHDAVSPSLLIAPDRTASIWYVQSGASGCSSTHTRLMLRTARPDADDQFEHAVWSAPVATDLAIPGYVPWHLDVASLPDGGYVAFIAAYPAGLTCSASDLWLATSTDGVHWHTAPVPLFWRGMKLARSRNMSTWYRGTMRYDPATDVLDLWPSALSGSNWTIYHATVKLRAVLNLLEQADAGDLTQMLARMSRQNIPRATVPMP